MTQSATESGSAGVADAATLLFVPGDRPERFAKALAARADAVVIDLEDAVAPDDKDAARTVVAEWLAADTDSAVAVRINADGTQWHRDDLTALAGTGATVMVAKAERPRALADSIAALGPDGDVIALIETARGVLSAADLAALPGVRRLAIGTFDLAAELGVDPDDRDALATARRTLVLASAAAGLAGPIDGVTASVDDAVRIADDVGYARRLGFAGKLCIHPRQIPPVAAAMRPSDAEVAWATKIGAAIAANPGAVTVVDGKMVDKPVIDRATRILRLAGNALDGDGRINQ